MNIRAGVIATALIAVSAFGDSITSNGTFSSFATSGFTTGQANPPVNVQGDNFWNNYSLDAGTGGSHDMNIGYALTDSGGFAGTPAVLGANTVNQALLGAGGSDPSSFAFNPTPTDYNIELISATSQLNVGTGGTVFGWYDVTNGVVTLHPLFGGGPVGNVTTPIAEGSFQPTLDGSATQYGFYATVCYNKPNCTAANEETYFTQSGMNTGALASTAGTAGSYNHFALFNLTGSADSYVVAFEDGESPSGPEADGDYNDIVIALLDPGVQVNTPEPGTMGVVGLGLLGLGLVSRRFKR